MQLLEFKYAPVQLDVKFYSLQNDGLAMHGFLDDVNLAPLIFVPGIWTPLSRFV
jgi:hypothetical protein